MLVQLLLHPRRQRSHNEFQCTINCSNGCVKPHKNHLVFPSQPVLCKEAICFIRLFLTPVIYLHHIVEKESNCLSVNI